MRDPVLRWYLGKADVETDTARAEAGGPLALIGGYWDDLEGFADRLAPERPVLDLTRRTPSARELRDLYAEHPETIVLAYRQERVATALGVIAQPWYMPVSPLTARPKEAVTLLRQAIEQLGVMRSLDALGADGVARLQAYRWPRGLHEIRQVAARLGAVLASGNKSAAARRLKVSHQAVSKYLGRRFN